MRTTLAIATLIFLPVPLLAQDDKPYDAGLKTVLIDSDKGEYFLSVRADTMGRLFVGSRESLFVYEPNAQGGYHPRKLVYRFPLDSFLNDVEVRGNDLYVLTCSALYIIPDGVRKRINLQPKKLIWGVPRVETYQAFHGLAWGPEGDLYLTMGDPLDDGRFPFPPDPPTNGWGHWTLFSQPDGTKTPYNGVGGVFRCRPDGSGLTIVASGFRSPGSLVFDRHWNLFSNDPGEFLDQCFFGRLLHVTPHAYFDWPHNDQFSLYGARADRFRNGIRADRLQTVTLDEGQGTLSYYDETFLPDEYRQNLLSMGIRRYPIEPSGASFQAKGHRLLHDSATSITVGRGGRIFFTSHFDARKLVMLTKVDDPPTHPYAPYEAAEATPEKLWQELSDPSWQRRYRAHIEIMRRSGNLLTEANKRLLAARATDPAFHSLIWLAAKSQKANVHLIALTDHADPLIRAQAIRALTEYPEQLREEPVFTKFLIDRHPQVQHVAVLAFFSPKIAWDRAIQQAIERGPACSKDSYLRQSATLLLAQKATIKQLEDLCGRFDAPLRLAGVLAAGFRLTLPDPTKSLAQHLPLKKLSEYASVIQYADGKVDLREHGRVGSFTLAEHWKADMHTVEQELTFKLLRKMLNDRDVQIRLQAAFFLSLLKDARSEPEVARVWKLAAAKKSPEDE